MKRHVLLVDDEPNVLSALQRTLRQCFPEDEVQVETFTDPEAALLRCADMPFDVVVTDYRMPGINGAEFLQVVKGVLPDAVRMVLSASTELSEVMNAVNRAELFRYLAKPWQTKELRETLLQAFIRHDEAAAQRRLADETRARMGELERQVLEARRLEAEEPGITHVRWGPDGSVLFE
jgi:DNA-binding NtrC family response regulator